MRIERTLRAHLKAWASVVLGVVLLSAGIDAVGFSATGSFGFGTAIGAFAYLAGLYGVIGVVLVGVAAIGTRFAPSRRDGYDAIWIVAAIAAIAVFVAIAYAIGLWVRAAFANAELSSLLAATLYVVSGAIVLNASRAVERFARQTESTAARRIVIGMTASVAVTATGWVVMENRTGLEQLSPWLIVMAVAIGAWALIAALSAKTFIRRSTTGARAFALVVAVGIVSFLIHETTDSRTPARLAEFAPLASWLAGPVQSLTDFDDDGHGAWLGGADCAPFDPDIAPGKLDIPGDGIDNNCIGGDASTSADFGEPQWYELDADWPRYNVLFVTVDTLRADHVGFMGYERNTTPHLDVLASRSTVFENFYATSTYTRMALASLFSSRSPSRVVFQKQTHTRQPRVAEKNPWLPAMLRDADFTTAGITADFPAFTEKERLGFDRGFADYDASAELRYRGGTMRGFPSPEQVERARKWLDDREKGERFFLWIHLFEPHYLYEQFPGAPEFGEERIDRYDSEIWGADKAIGDLLAHLKKSGRADDTIVVVLGDHGEEFEEHGRRYHGSNLYEPQVRTPLVIHVPGRPGRRVATPASFVDVAPTVLNLTGVKEGFERFEGRNLTPVFFDEEIPDRPLILEVWKIKSLRNHKIAVVNWPYKLIADGTTGGGQELYDVVSDPMERDDLHRKLPDVTDSMQRVLYDYLDHTELSYEPAPESP